jgi:hypothetical protein
VTPTPFPLKEYGLNEPRRSEEHEGRKKKEEGRRKKIDNFVMGREDHQSGDENVDGFPQMVMGYELCTVDSA